MPAGPASPSPEWWCRRPEPRRVAIGPGWKGWSGGLIPRLAREIHVEGTHDRMGRLVEALEQAGRADPTILDHLRGSPHWRGCWVLDRLMVGESPRPA